MIFISKLIPVFLYPLGLSLLIFFVSFLFLCLERKKAASFLIIAGVFVLYIFSNQIISDSLLKSLERKYKTISADSVKADVIVVLGGGSRPKMYPRSHSEFNEAGDRIIHGRRLFMANAAPYILVTGGGIDFILKGQKSAYDMRDLLVELGVPKNSIIIEDKARNTYENAVNTLKILKQRKISKNIILVTSAFHMPRSVAIFKKAGFNVVAAPTDFIVLDRKYNWFSLLPGIGKLFWSTVAIKEYIGMFAYKLFGWL